MIATIAINIAALGLPLLGRQIINHGGADPTGLAIPLLVTAVIGIAFVEGGMRLSRSILVIENDRRFMTTGLEWLIAQVVGNPRYTFGSAAAASIDLTRAMEQAKQEVNGETVIARAEIAFIPVLVLAIFAVNWVCGIFVVLFMSGFALLALRETNRYVAIAEANRGGVERRFQTLFAILERMEIVKSNAVEHRMARLYEQANGHTMRQELALCVSGIRLNQLSVMAGMMMTSLLLFVCALVAEGDQINLATVITVILLSSRLMDPIQRVVFLHTQARDRENASAKIAAVVPDGRDSEVPADMPSFDRLRECRLAGLRPKLRGIDAAATKPISLKIAPGEIIAIVSDRPEDAGALLRCMAGLDDPADGQVDINGHDIRSYGPDDRNRIVGYLSPDARLFDGTILDNVTRFGEVPVEDAYAVAELMGLAARLDALPRGLQTATGGLTGGSVPPGLVRQIALLRGISHRPRMILFDHADASLDRDGYAGLLSFFEAVRGLATVVLATEDANLTSMADRTFRYADGVLTEQQIDRGSLQSYSALTL